MPFCLADLDTGLEATLSSEIWVTAAHRPVEVFVSPVLPAPLHIQHEARQISKVATEISSREKSVGSRRLPEQLLKHELSSTYTFV